MKNSLVSLFAGCALIFLIFQGVGALVEPLPYIFGAAIVLISVFSAVLFFDVWYSKISLRQAFNRSGLHHATIRQLAPGIVICLLLLLQYPLFRFVLHTNVYLATGWFYNLIGVALTGGLAEEAFFRGFLFRHLRATHSFKKATLLSMLFFAVVHLVLFATKHWSIALFSTLLAVAISLPLSYLYERAGNTIWAPALVHTIIRTIGLVVVIPEPAFLQATLLWMAGCMVIPYLVIICYGDFKMIWKKGIGDLRKAAYTNANMSI